MDNRYPSRSKFDKGVIGGVEVEGVLLQVMHIGMKIVKVNLEPFGSDGDAVGDGFHDPRVVGVSLHGTWSPVA